MNHSRTAHTPLIMLGAVAALMMMSSSAMAQRAPHELARYTPASSRIVVGGNVHSARKTAAFAEMMKLIREQGKDVLTLLDKRIGFKLERDLHAFAVGLPNSRRGKPSARVFTLALSGTFDEARITKSLLEEKKKKGGKAKQRTLGKLTIIQPDRRTELALIDKNTLIIVHGSAKYRDAAWRVVQGKGKHAMKTSTMRKLFKKVKKNKHIWVLANTARMKQPPEPFLQWATATMDFTSGLKLHTQVKMKTEEGAKKAVEDFEKNRMTTAFMLGAYGAGPLVSNLKLARAKSTLTMNTHMNEDQLRGMVKALKAAQKSKKRPPVPTRTSAPKKAAP